MNVNEKYNALMNAKSAEEMWQLRETLKENNDIIDSSQIKCVSDVFHIMKMKNT